MQAQSARHFEKMDVDDNGVIDAADRKARHAQHFSKIDSNGDGQLSQEEMSADSIQYWGLAPELLVEQILYAIDQPWGIVISDLTVRAANDRYVL